MIKSILPVAVLALWANTALWGQSMFNRMYSSGNSSAFLADCVLPTDSAHYVLGTSNQTGQGIRQYVNFLKLDTLGNVLVSKKYGIDTALTFPAPAAIYQKDGIVFGLCQNVEMEIVNGIYFITDTFPVIIEFNTDGDTIAVHRLKLTADPTIRYNYPAYELLFMDTGYLLSAEKWEYNPNGNFVMADITLIRLDDHWNQLWTRSFGTPGSTPDLRPSIVKYGDSLVLLYNTLGNQSLSTTHIRLLDTLGNTIWHYYTPMAEDIFSWDFKMTSDSGFLYCGYQGILNNNGDIYPKSYICKLNANRQVLWERGLGLAGVGEMTRCHELSDGTIVGAGRIPKIQPGLQDSLGYSGYLAKLSPQGDSIWLRYYEIVPGNTDYHTVWDMKPCPDGGFIFCGEAHDLIDFQNYPQRAWVVKTDSFGCVVPGCQLYDAIHEPPSPAEQIPILVYPNPASSVVNVYLPPFAAQVEGLSYTLTDMQGRRVKEWAADGLGGTTYMVPVGELAAGVYVLTLWERGRVVGAKELIIE